MADEGGVIREVSVRFSVDTEGGEEKLEHVNDAATKAKEGVREAGEHAEKSGGFFAELGEAVEGLATAFVGSELLKSVKETTEGLESLAHLSEQTGIATGQLEFFGFVVGQVGGDVQEFQGNISALQRALAKGETATSPAGVALTKLGIQTKDAAGNARGMNDVLPEIFENFGKLKNPAEEAAVAQRLFGKSGLALLPVLREGAKGFEEYKAQFEATGGATPEESIKAAQEYERSLKRLDAAFGDLKTHLVTGVLPSLTHVVELLTSGGASLSRFLKGTTASQHAIVALAAALGGPLFGALKPFLTKGLKFLAIYAAVDDLLAFIEGKQSLLQDAIDGLFGKGSSDQVREFFGVAKAEFALLAADGDAAYTILNDSNANWFDRVVAGFALVVGQGSDTFTAIKEGWESILLSMDQALAKFVDAALAKVQQVAQAFATVAKVVGVLSLGTTLPAAAIAQGVADKAGQARGGVQEVERGLQAGQDELGQRAYAREQSKPAAVAGQGLRDAQGNVLDPRAAALAQRNQQIQQATEGRKAEEFATLGVARAAGITATLNDNKQITLNFKAGTNEELVAQVQAAIKAATKDDNRAALQQVTQRGSK